MTREQFTAKLPKLTNNPLPIKPPFVFNGMSTRVFPLRANLDTLQRLCDGYLNFVPPEAGYFRAALPYVFLMVLDYGQVAETVARIGWFAQTEVFFSVAVEWYKRVRGTWVFHDWAVITPYIFVNDDFSVPLGRTVVGFPKVLARVTQVDSAWLKDPASPVTVARVETRVFPEAYSGADIQSRVFLQIERATTAGLQIPLDPSHPMFPSTVASNFVSAVTGFTSDMTWMAQSMRISPVTPLSNPGMFPEMVARMAPWFAPGRPGFLQNSINLKQFRQSDKPDQICYQALTYGSMQTTAFNGGGLLGDNRIMLGDLSGGYSIQLYDYASLPIVRTLGLQPHRQWQGADSTVAELKPVVPFWINVDLTYDTGENVAWRSDDGVWKDSAGVPFKTQARPGDDGAPQFNNTVISIVDQIAGPFEYSDTTIRVLPLLAEKKKLQDYLDQYINKPLSGPMKNENERVERIQFKVWARGEETEPADERDAGRYAYVYLMVSSFGSVTSTTNNVGNWAKYQLSFMIPVEFQRMDEQGNWTVAGVGLVPAASFVDDCIAAISRLEVQGFEATVANFFKPESVWLSDDVELCAKPKQTLLRVDAEVWPALGEGQKASIRPIIEISQGDPDAGLGDAPEAPWNWARLLRRELLQKKTIKAQFPGDLKIARALALELLGHRVPFVAYSMKEFRDCSDPEKACYQSLVRVPRSIKELLDLREIEETLVVRIHDYPVLDIVGQLGLVANRVPIAETGIVNSLQVIRPFFIRATLYEPLAERLASRAGAEDWTLFSQTAFSTLLSDQEGAPPITADDRAESLQDEMEPCRISAIMEQAWQREKWTAEKRKERDCPSISKRDARRALSKVDPQTVIECALSREWGNADGNARWRGGRRELIRAFEPLSVRDQMSVFAESVLYRKRNNQLAGNPGAVASRVAEENVCYPNPNDVIARLSKEKPLAASARWQNAVERVILGQEQFTRYRVEMETAVADLASAAILQKPGIEEFYQGWGGSKYGGTPPSDADFAKLGAGLIDTLKSISEQQIEGEPSDRNNLDAQVRAGRSRLKELLTELSIHGLEAPPDSVQQAEEYVAWALSHSETFREMVQLALACCSAQNDAFLNKLSRAYQKPDFCVRRDSVVSKADQLLPLSLSWNADWYYGREKEYMSSAPMRDLIPATPAKGDAAGGGGTEPPDDSSHGKEGTQ